MSIKITFMILKYYFFFYEVKKKNHNFLYFILKEKVCIFHIHDLHIK
jgi:hypothetical protein